MTKPTSLAGYQTVCEQRIREDDLIIPNYSTSPDDWLDGESASVHGYYTDKNGVWGNVRVYRRMPVVNHPAIMQASVFTTGITPAQAERLAILAEECGEVVQAVGKILRHGYESTHPDGGPTNRQHLEVELGNIKAIERLMVAAGDIEIEKVYDSAIAKVQSINKYTHHQ